ncbi:membrane hypothetical protein [Candidatus Sulfopaludibacter sp. SbA3]|nr:membrane hypothetical protein [Candidatus Sulfopaludibacter sp. SbA3]
MLEFVTWFVWLLLFALLQRRLCRQFPGIRSLCRNAFLATLAIAILPAAWILIHYPHGAPHLLRVLNHYFGIGVYLQTSLRALIQLRWLALAPLHMGLRMPHPTLTLTRERQLLALMVTSPQMLAGGRTPEEDRRRV